MIAVKLWFVIISFYYQNTGKDIFFFLGRETVRRLSNIGIKCSYVLINAASFIIKEVRYTSMRMF